MNPTPAHIVKAIAQIKLAKPRTVRKDEKGRVITFGHARSVRLAQTLLNGSLGRTVC